ncbi:MAG: hypothetical protein B5M53_09045 [Candidatus Cloacimonas sp. 4484_209]|nr:MAG: hypothetical protein B5M53_09045 [Candidatus Cloacimonas sp. 4484_209]
MAIKAIEVFIESDQRRGQYVLDNFLTIIGYPFRFVKSWQNPVVKIVYGSSRIGEADIFIPEFTEVNNYSNLQVTYLDDIPILYTGVKPVKLWSDNCIGFDLVGFSFYMLSRQEERRFVNFSVFLSPLYDLGLSNEPVVSYYIIILKQAIEQILKQKRIRLLQEPLWPDKKDFAVILSHDVDHVGLCNPRIALNFLRNCIEAKFSRRQRFEALVRAIEQFSFWIKGSAAWNLERWIDLEDKYNFRSTFYFAALDKLGLVSENNKTSLEPLYTLKDKVCVKGKVITIAELIRFLDKEGWEIGLHGSLRSYNNRRVLQKERNNLSNILGKDIIGIRQHYLKFEVPITWLIQEKCGFKYDTTLGYNERIGYRAGMTFPYLTYDLSQNRKLNLIEFPLTIQDVVLFQKEPTSIEKSIKRCIMIIEKIKKLNGLAVLLWHPGGVVYEKEESKYFNVYQSILEYLNTQNGYIATAKEILNWWKKRKLKISLDGK